MDPRETLEWLNIEFCSSCNLRCKWCSLDHTKPRQLMSVETLDKVLGDLVGPEGFQLDRIELHSGGETLLHPELDAMLSVVAGYKARLPEVHLLTNAVALSEGRARTLLDSGALDLLRVSIDGGTAASFEELRAPAKWEKVHQNVSRFLDLNRESIRPIRTGVVGVVDPERTLSTDWMEPEFQSLFARLDEVSIRHPHNWDGSENLGIDDVSYRFHEEISKGKVCYFLTKDLVILPDGRVTVCCADLNARGVIGNILESSLREVFFSPERLEMLRLFAAGRKDDIELCRSCTGYYT